MSLARPVLTAMIWAVLIPSAWAQTSYPMLGRIEPTALQRGRETEIMISGTGSFAGAWQLLCEGPGVSGQVLDAKEAPEATTAKGKGRRADRGAVKARLSATASRRMRPSCGAEVEMAERGSRGNIDNEQHGVGITTYPGSPRSSHAGRRSV